MINFVNGASRPKRAILTTSTTEEVSLKNCKTLDNADIDMSFYGDIKGIVVRMRKPIDTSANAVPEEDYVLYVAEEPNQMQPGASFDYHNHGIFDTIQGDQEWSMIDINFAPRPNVADGFNNYNFYFAARRESNVTGHNAAQWRAVVLEVLIYH